MPKNIEDMIVPERRRSIRDIPIPEGRRKNTRYVSPVSPVPNISQEQSLPEEKYEDFHSGGEEKRFSKVPRKGVWISAGLAIVVLIFAILSIFNGATLSYVPKSSNLVFSNDFFSARKGEDGKLIYSVIKLSGDKGKEVQASGEKEVSRKASGTIVVYNNTTEAQRLRATTRFETTDHKIYQVADTIVVPAKKIIDGVNKPGSLEITVYAATAGESYNIGLTDFTLPGLEGTSLFSTVYARSKTEMSGGFVGMEKVVSADDETKTQTELYAKLREELISDAMAQVPEGFILIPSLASVTFESLPQSGSTNKNSTTINIRGNLYGVMFKRSELSLYLAINKIDIAPNELINIIGLEKLDFSFATATEAVLINSDEISFSVTGSAVAEWQTDEIALRSDLVGRNKRDLLSILKNYPTVSSANATIRPIWKSNFPKDSTRITIKKVPVN